MEFDGDFQRQLGSLVHWRRDVRHFKPDPVDPALVKKLIELACHAPSVGLSQPWRFVEVKDAEARRRVQSSFKRCNAQALASYEGDRAKIYAALKLEGLREAPVQFAVFADETTQKGAGLGSRTMPETLRYSVVMAVHTLWLAARAHNLGLGWVSIIDADEVKTALAVPEAWRLVAYLCLGWPQQLDDVPELERRGWETRSLPEDILISK